VNWLADGLRRNFNLSTTTECANEGLFAATQPSQSRCTLHANFSIAEQRKRLTGLHAAAW
jgi:hypothetical protein